MGFKFPPGFHLPRRGGMKKERKDGGREERRLTGRKRAGASWGLGSFFVWAKGRVFGHLPWNPPAPPPPLPGHLSCRFLCPWRPGVFTRHPNGSPMIRLIPSTSHSFREAAAFPTPRACQSRSESQIRRANFRESLGFRCLRGWAPPATFHSAGLKSRPFFYKSLVQAQIIQLIELHRHHLCVI